jgi:hypothetical protein
MKRSVMSMTCACCVLIAAPVRADRIQLRDQETPLQGKILVMNADGITISVGEQPMRVVSWDRVASFEHDQPHADAEKYADLAMNLWRGRSRVERGDSRLALPVFEELASQYHGTTSETALVVMEGLLRCRLDQGANDLAVVPALEVARLRLKGVTTNSYSNLPPVLDSATLLCPVLPPVWVSTPALLKVERRLAEYDAGAEPALIAQAALYRQAMRRQLALPVDTIAGGKTDNKGLQFLMTIQELSSSSPSDRAAIRERLLRQAEPLGDWAQAWARYFVGVSLLAESGEDARLEGIVSLLHVPARFSDTQPYLAGLALAESSQELAASGNAEAAVAVDEELRRSFPRHPALVTGSHRPISRSSKESS